MKQSITIPVFITNESTEQLEELEIAYTLEAADVVDYTFFRIDFIAPYIDRDEDAGKEYGLIHIGGLNMVTPWSHEKLKKAIEKTFA